jgi:1,2-diacylglycerol 3-alpha-glucosyltransferase
MAFFWHKPAPTKLNICLVTKKFPYPGRESDENYLWPMARGLAKRGHDVVVFSWTNPRGKAEIVSGNVRALFLGEQKYARRAQFSQMVLDKFEELHAQKQFHIVHGLDESALLIGRHRKRLGVAVTYDISASQMSQIFSILGMAQETLGGLLSTGVALFYKFLTTYFSTDRALLSTADGVFVATPIQQIMLERYYLYPELKTFIVPYGMDYIETQIHTPSEDLKAKVGITASSQVVLTFTDMTELEEVTNLLRAFQKVVIKKTNARLIILGNGPLKKNIEFETLDLALGSKVFFAGAIPSEELSDYLAISDVYVNLSSRTTGFEPTMLGAMAQKKVVIGSELSPIATIIEDGIDGFLVRPADVKTLTELITAIFSGDFKSRNGQMTAQEIGLKAREKVINLFDVEKMVDLMLTAFYKTLNNVGGRLTNYKSNPSATSRPAENTPPPPA